MRWSIRGGENFDEDDWSVDVAGDWIGDGTPFSMPLAHSAESPRTCNPSSSIGSRRECATDGAGD